MHRWRQILPVLALGALLASCSRGDGASQIRGFSPSSFREQAERPFFYTIGNVLRYGTSIDPEAPNFGGADTWSVLPAPDGKTAVGVHEDTVFVVDGPSGRRTNVGPAGHPMDDSTQVGGVWFREREFEWSRDSASLYLIRDHGSDDIHSDRAELCRYDLASGSIETVIRPFRSSWCALGDGGRIYFSVPDASGNLLLRCWDGARIREVESTLGCRVKLAGGGQEFEERFFRTLDKHSSRIVVNAIGLSVEWNGDPETDAVLRLRDRELLRIHPTRSRKGPIVRVQLDETALLPGDRYLVVQGPKMLLFDLETGAYRELPERTSVYPQLDSDDYSRVEITQFCVRGDMGLFRIR